MRTESLSMRMTRAIVRIQPYWHEGVKRRNISIIVAVVLMNLMTVARVLKFRNRPVVEEIELRGLSRRRCVRARIGMLVDGLSPKVKERLYLHVVSSVEH